MLRGLLPLLALLPALAARPAAADDPARALEQQVRRVIVAAEPSVVAVVASHMKYPGPAPDRLTGRLGRYAAPPRNPLAAWNPPPPAVTRLDLSDPQTVADHQFGSGLVLDTRADGPPVPGALVLTSFHLIDGATKVFVRAASGKGCYADVHAADSRSDLAVLRLLDPVPGLAPVRFADVRLADGPGDEKATVYRGLSVVALGHPLAAGFIDGAASASAGMIGNVRRRAAGPGREDARYRTARGLYHYGSLLQTDARVTLGCSGGALFDLDGRLVGLTAPLAAVTGADTAGGYAIPFDQNYRRIVRTLQDGREVEYGFLGVALSDAARRPAAGVGIGSVTPGSPAADAGLRGQDTDGDRADAITAIDGQPVRDPDDLFLHVGAALAGSKVRLTLAPRSGAGAGRERGADVVLVKHHNGMPWLASARPPAVAGLRVDYASTLVGLTQAGGGTAALIEDGVLVREVEPGSPAATALPAAAGNDPPPRWLVTWVNDRPVGTPDEFLRAAAGQASVRLRVRDRTANGAERDIVLPGVRP